MFLPLHISGLPGKRLRQWFLFLCRLSTKMAVSSLELTAIFLLAEVGAT